MPTAVCGKRLLFDDIHGSPPVAKRLRCGGSSPVRLSQSFVLRSGSSLGPSEAEPSHFSLPSEVEDQLSRLCCLFPDMDGRLVEKVLESCGSNLDSAIKSLNDLRFVINEKGTRLCSTVDSVAISRNDPSAEVGSTPANVGTIPVEDHGSGAVPVFGGTEWVELFVREILSAPNLDDARSCAIRAFGAVEKAILVRNEVMLEGLQKENAALKSQQEVYIRDNHILKRAVTIQHEHQLEYEKCFRELQQLKQLLSQYQEQVRNLELNNYALSVHLRKAQEGTCIPGRICPDVF
eukprot:c28840_g2_i3 orf=556-1431(+)